MANKIANGLLSSGIKRGDRVALCCPNIPQFIFAYFGILKAGCVVLPFNVLLKNNEIEFILDNSQASAIICFEGTEELPIANEVKKAFEKSNSCKKMWVIKSLDNFVLGNNICDFLVLSNSEAMLLILCNVLLRILQSFYILLGLLENQRVLNLHMQIYYLMQISVRI